MALTVRAPLEQYGHWKSVNSTIATGAAGFPRTMRPSGFALAQAAEKITKAIDTMNSNLGETKSNIFEMENAVDKAFSTSTFFENRLNNTTTYAKEVQKLSEDIFVGSKKMNDSVNLVGRAQLARVNANKILNGNSNEVASNELTAIEQEVIEVANNSDWRTNTNSQDKIEHLYEQLFMNIEKEMN